MVSNKVVITVVSILVSAALLSLNFMTVASGEVTEDAQLDTKLHRSDEMKVDERDLVKYARVSPETFHPDSAIVVTRSSPVSTQSNGLSLTATEGVQGQQTNFEFQKIRFLDRGNTVKLQALDFRSAIDIPEASVIEDTPGAGQELDLLQDRYLDEPALGYSGQGVSVAPAEDHPIEVIEVHYDLLGNYDSRKTWSNVEATDLLARAMLAEENEKLFDPERVLDFIGAGWVMINRTHRSDGFFSYADENLFGALVPYFQFALGGIKDANGIILPGNAAIVANPEAYPGWFGGDPQRYYREAYRVAAGILNGTIPDPTGGALYFADFYITEDGSAQPFEDGRTRFWYLGHPSFSLPDLQELNDIPWSSH